MYINDKTLLKVFQEWERKPSGFIVLALFSLLFAASAPQQAGAVSNELEKNELAKSLPSPQLLSNFTLQYRVQVQDLRTAGMRYKDASQVRNYPVWKYRLVRGLTSSAYIEQLVCAAQAKAVFPVKKRTYLVTVSAWNGRLFYRSTQVGRQENDGDDSRKADITLIYNGFTTSTKSGSQPSFTDVEAWRTDPMINCLVPGVGMLYLPLYKPLPGDRITPNRISLCLVASLNPWTPPGMTDIYVPGAVRIQSFQGRPWVTTMAAGEPGRYWARWSYDQPHLLQNVCVASHASWTRYRFTENGHAVSPVPEACADYKLLAFQTSALPAKDFAVDEKSQQSAWVGAASSFFVYDPAAGTSGSLEDIIQDARAQSAMQEARNNEQAERIQADESNHGNGKSAAAILADAEQQAKASKCGIFLTFHASWCGSCYLMHRFLNDPQIKSLLKTHFVVVELDIFEHGNNHWNNSGGETLFASYGGAISNSIPFYAILNASGKMRSNSVYHDKNFGFPGSGSLINLFLSQLRRSSPSLTAEDLSVIRAGLRRQLMQN